jgi:hypothetical protein
LAGFESCAGFIEFINLTANEELDRIFAIKNSLPVRLRELKLSKLSSIGFSCILDEAKLKATQIILDNKTIKGKFIEFIDSQQMNGDCIYTEAYIPNLDHSTPRLHGLEKLLDVLYRIKCDKGRREAITIIITHNYVTSHLPL